MVGIEDRVNADRVGARRARRAAAGSFIGAVVEWYDFLLYGIVAALVFGELFFPDYSSHAGTLAAFATFGVGFIFRPLGGIIFGHFGDRLGRKSMLVWTMTIMGVATALIGFLPTYQSVGWLAPALLVLLRCIQGIAVGGEWGGAALMAVESAPSKLRAFFASGVQIGYSFGLLLATGFVALLSSNFSAEAFLAWGWRIPFFFSAVLVIVGLWIRAGVEESGEYVERVKNAKTDKTAKLPILEAFKRYPAQIFQIVGLRFIELLTMYIVTTFALSYSTEQLGLDRQVMLNITLLVGGLGIVTIPAFAYLSDRYGRLRVYLTGGVIGLVSAVPFFLFLEAGNIVGIVIFAVLLINIAHDAVVSVQQPLFAEMFSPEFRYSGAGVGYQLASAIAGGFTPFIATFLVGLGDGTWYLVAAYLGGGCLISISIAMFLVRKWQVGRRTECSTADAARIVSA
ncbi:shikimate transporter [Brevibacterium linens]|uniref:Putative proline/betaine transporter n=2 Tax=Brevibacterium linens TaxID=1703 RepID=A0A2H1IV60_BRELN|nr:shikimate transporter [Brevibacterium linens]AZU01698.1 shikimate transporter [Brevibacterium linens]KAB1942585.1 shikimate transporter [Brevibacterium linens ATCC 9172]SMX79093.1 MFS transporter, MHS family, shikimate and dehydroshikimate transport protein [Brevibacterium linens]SMY01762.1 MFS transporter, MHS family, shikimate and dehydroshikimate transport protein [Brevibacterium linens ATCC 9172]